MSRVAIVTGGASGIGRATVELLESQGVNVAVFDRNGETPVDVSDAAAVGRAVEEARGRLGPIDILVNAAGIGTGGPLDGENYVEVWDRTLAVNLTAAMFLVRACLEDLVRSGNGRIVNVASTEALSAGPFTSPYTVSKHGLLGFTRSLAVDLAGQGVTANCVCPGATLTGLTEGIPGRRSREIRPAPCPRRPLRPARGGGLHDRGPDRPGSLLRERRRDRSRRGHDGAGPMRRSR